MTAMPNWNHIARNHLAVSRLTPEREIEKALSLFSTTFYYNHEGWRTICFEKWGQT